MADTLNSIVDRSISEFEDDKVKRVGKNAFRGCEELSSVTLPSVRAIGDKAFKDCTSLEDITVGDNYDGVVSVNDDSFDGCNPINVIVPKDKVDLYKKSDSWSGFVEKCLTVNWGKCGGTEDVITTFKEGDPLYIPKNFLTLGKTMSQLVAYTDDKLDTEVGYKTWFCSDDTGSATERNTTRSYWINVYKLPQELGKWLYENAEDNLGEHKDYSDSNDGGGIMDRNYKGIAFYPDDALYYINSQEWGIGIRKKEDLCVVGYSLSGGVMTPTKAIGTGSPSIACIENFSQYKALEDDAYYLVAQASSDDTTEKYALNPVANFFGNSTIYLRHWNTMTAKPDVGNMGEKYTVTSELCTTPIEGKSGTQGSIYGMKDTITVNWGKCGGTTDVTVTYKKGEGIWIPYAFLNEPFVTYPSTFSGNLVKSGNEVGWKVYRNNNELYYKLPQVIGKWLYENAEDCKDRVCYGLSSAPRGRAYKGIAIYPDSIGSNTSSDWYGSQGWRVGIRKKSDVDVIEWTTSGGLSRNSDIANLAKTNFEDDSYYLVAQQGGTTSFITSGSSYVSYCLGAQLSTWGINDTGSDHIYFRHYNTMTSAPSATNKGKKYDIDNSLAKQFTLPLTVNWGKCGGTEDVIVNYDKDEGLWIPKEFLTLGKNLSELMAYTGDQLFLSDNVTKDTSVGYKTWFGESDYDNRTTRASRSYYHINIYKLPQGLGEYLYENSESNLGTHLDYSTSTTDSKNVSMNRNYKGIALYPDTVNDWSSSNEWGIGIRKKEDLCIIGHMMIDDVMTPVKKFYENGARDISCIESYSQYQALEDDAYYLVAQASIQSTNNCAINPILNLFGDNKLYLRHYNTLTAKPNGTSVMGKKYDVPMSLPPDDAKPLGGKIFYIDPTDNGATYTFYDASGKKVKGTTASELASAKYYAKSGTSTADKVYVYYPEKFDSLQWGYNGTSISGTGTEVGTGKTNTATVMSRTDIPTGTIWSKLSEIRASSGIDDLFIPSKDEIDKFRVADLEAWHRSSGGSYLWSSSESSAGNAWYWYYYTQSWNDYAKSTNLSVFFVRAF